MQDLTLQGRSALVTGGGRGIGRSTALYLAARGATVAVSARSGDEIESVAQEIVSHGGKARAVRADISVEADVRALVDVIGHVDILINNAGVIEPIARLARVESGAWMRNVEINLGGVFLPTRHVLPSMLDRGWGRIINVSSGAAGGKTEGWSAYSAAKAGVETLTRVLALEIANTGVTVNAMRPGVVDTEMQVQIRASDEESFGRANLERFRGYKERGALRDPDDPARLILWMLSPEAGELNGEVLAIDDPDVAAKAGLPLKPR